MHTTVATTATTCARSRDTSTRLAHRTAVHTTRRPEVLARVQDGRQRLRYVPRQREELVRGGGLHRGVSCRQQQVVGLRLSCDGHGRRRTPGRLRVGGRHQSDTCRFRWRWNNGWRRVSDGGRVGQRSVRRRHRCVVLPGRQHLQKWVRSVLAPRWKANKGASQ